MDRTFRKTNRATPGFFAAEVAGLRWLAQATSDGGAHVVPVISSGPSHIELARLIPVAPSRTDAQEFGRALAYTHLAGAPHQGAPPPELAGDGFIATLRLPHDIRDGATLPAQQDLPWGRFYARLRLAPFARAARDRGHLEPAAARAIDRVCERLETDDEELTGPAEPVARLHGDLWSGNVVWTSSGGVLIDPAAHGGHRETDLAMLELFGLPHLSHVTAAYHETASLATGWRERTGLHQLHPLLVHAVLFGGSYGSHAGQIARRYG